MEDVAAAVAAARGGEQAAWRRLVDGHAGLVWSIIRGFRFDDETARDVFQTVWLRLDEHLDRIREPERLAGWLGQTVRNECIGVVCQRDRLAFHDDLDDLALPPEWCEPAFPLPGEALERDESRQAVAAAYRRLGERCQQLLALLVADPPTPYEQISTKLDMPIGSIGPTRARCLSTLRSSPEVARITGGPRSS